MFNHSTLFLVLGQEGRTAVSLSGIWVVNVFWSSMPGWAVAREGWKGWGRPGKDVASTLARVRAPDSLVPRQGEEEAAAR